MEYSRNEILDGCRRNATFIREIMMHALSTPLTLPSVFPHKNNGVQQHVVFFHLKLNAGRESIMHRVSQRKAKKCFLERH